MASLSNSLAPTAWRDYKTGDLFMPRTFKCFIDGASYWRPAHKCKRIEKDGKVLFEIKNKVRAVKLLKILSDPSTLDSIKL